ncbi:MAG TPA: hypothetical protein VHU81_10235 [Thermoanaerobaculia bacterium]|jgi:hypothetical protein|nr:hypothetical protein [Thermoanaerobaculia bacterium]
MINPEHQIGEQITYFEEPDIIYMKLIGTLQEEDGLEVNRRHREFARGREHIFFLIDLSELQSIHPVVRKAATETLKEVPLRGIAVCQAPLKARVIAKLITTALNMFKSDAAKNPVEFTDTEEAARTWIAARRREILNAA